MDPGSISAQNNLSSPKTIYGAMELGICFDRKEILTYSSSSHPPLALTPKMSHLFLSTTTKRHWLASFLAFHHQSTIGWPQALLHGHFCSQWGNSHGNLYVSLSSPPTISDIKVDQDIYLQPLRMHMKSMESKEISCPWSQLASSISRTPPIVLPQEDNCSKQQHIITLYSLS